ncbi:MAG TPA: hypothetical protein VL461_13125 [Dictyobacter sp.]|nr:hypothetical protein [Dictyobacter sp.]
MAQYFRNTFCDNNKKKREYRLSRLHKSDTSTFLLPSSLPGLVTRDQSPPTRRHPLSIPVTITGVQATS